METVKNIVLAKQANCNSDSVLSYAVQLSDTLKAKLTVGLCYQSDTELAGAEDLREANPIKDAFQYVKQSYLDSANVDYRLVSCETTSCDRADETLTIYLPDLYLMDKSQVEHLYSFIDRIYCPLILLPHQVEFKPVNHLLVVGDLNEKEREHTPRHAHNLATIFSASYEMLDFSDLSESLFNMPASHPEADLKSFKGPIRLYPEKLSQMRKPDMLVLMVKDKFFGVMRSFYGPAIELSKRLDFPVMIYKV
ncbi:hypothetical protein PZB74_19225 [Porifericola rhodea]|uniref:hypothetical protein n=1 Tax=Porifericola rhodea TaxID=930972 RepID=UPI002665CBBF|nr:hypothetical protein [Porifericola rhodea]WKN31085.1 hypothetical protein PZB74_19225 [Porifericola rhodea]